MYNLIKYMPMNMIQASIPQVPSSFIVSFPTFFASFLHTFLIPRKPLNNLFPLTENWFTYSKVVQE